jgi:hypothetical protein
MEEGIKFITLWRGEIHRFRVKIIDFLLDLDEERETIFPREELFGKTDLEGFNKIVENTLCMVLALSRNGIIGLTGLLLYGNRLNIIGDAWPFVYSYTVVKRTFQEKGIGTSLWMKRQEDTYGRFAFIISRTRRDNIPARKIDVKFDFKRVYEDELFVYSVKPCRKELYIFILFIMIALRLKSRLNSFLSRARLNKKDPTSYSVNA